jgi:hypothetical protein
MTTPPYGPYGQEPSGANPYGPGPYWGGQPQGGPPPGGPPHGGPYPPPQGYPYPGMPYGTQPYPAPGQQFGPGGPMGPYPPGRPPKRPGSKTPWLIGVGVVVAVVVMVAATLVLVRSGHNESPSAGGLSTPAVPLGPSSPPGVPPPYAQNATGCTPNVSAGTPPTGDTVRAGALSFPASAAPGWTPFGDDETPNGIDVVGLAREVPGAEKWVMQAEVGITNFVASMDVATQASKLMTCIAGGPGYETSQPSLGPTKESSTRVDGTEAARVDADITIADPARGVPGDSVVIIVVKTKPATFFFGASPIGNAEDRAIIDRVIASLKVSKH